MLIVSGPSRGMGWFLPKAKKQDFTFVHVSGPSRGLGGFLPWSIRNLNSAGDVFPSPLEVWVGSYY